MSESTFKVGQQVTVWSAPHAGHKKTQGRVTTVAKVGVRKMTLADGSEWSADGSKPFGYKWSTFSTPDRVKPTEPGDEEAVRCRRALATIGRLRGDDWTRATTEELETARVIAERLLSTRPT